MKLQRWQRTPGSSRFGGRCHLPFCFVLPFFLVSFILSGQTFASDRSSDSTHTTHAATDTTSARLTGDQIITELVARDAQRARQMPRYTATRYYTLDYNGFPSSKHAEMTVEVVSDPPAPKRLTIVSEKGSKLLLEHVLRKLVENETEASQAGVRREVALTPENYTFKLLGNDVVDGRRCYVFDVEPRRKAKFLYEGKIWIDAQDFAVTQISAKPAKNPSLWISSVQIDHRYAKHGDTWLPASNRSQSKVRFGGEAVLTIDYNRYEFASTENKTQSSR